MLLFSQHLSLGSINRSQDTRVTRDGWSVEQRCRPLYLEVAKTSSESILMIGRLVPCGSSDRSVITICMRRRVSCFCMTYSHNTSFEIRPCTYGSMMDSTDVKKVVPSHWKLACYYSTKEYVPENGFRFQSWSASSCACAASAGDYVPYTGLLCTCIGLGLTGASFAYATRFVLPKI